MAKQVVEAISIKAPNFKRIEFTLTGTAPLMQARFSEKARQKMHDTQEWKDALKANSWADAFATGDDFGAFIKEQDKRVADTLGELGLA